MIVYKKKRGVIHHLFGEYCRENDITPGDWQSYLGFMATLPFKPKEYKYISKNKEFSPLKKIC